VGSAFFLEALDHPNSLAIKIIRQQGGMRIDDNLPFFGGVLEKARNVP
jgi:hypothetical protein